MEIVKIVEMCENLQILCMSVQYHTIHATTVAPVWKYVCFPVLTKVKFCLTNISFLNDAFLCLPVPPARGYLYVLFS